MTALTRNAINLAAAGLLGGAAAAFYFAGPLGLGENEAFVLWRVFGLPRRAAFLGSIALLVLVLAVNNRIDRAIGAAVSAALRAAATRLSRIRLLPKPAADFLSAAARRSGRISGRRKVAYMLGILFVSAAIAEGQTRLRIILENYGSIANTFELAYSGVKDPGMGWRMLPYSTYFGTNNLGLVSTTDFEFADLRDRFVVGIYGDSYAASFPRQISGSKSWAELLEDRLNASSEWRALTGGRETKVVNFSVPGASVTQLWDIMEHWRSVHVDVRIVNFIQENTIRKRFVNPGSPDPAEFEALMEGGAATAHARLRRYMILHVLAAPTSEFLALNFRSLGIPVTLRPEHIAEAFSNRYTPSSRDTRFPDEPTYTDPKPGFDESRAAIERIRAYDPRALFVVMPAYLDFPVIRDRLPRGYRNRLVDTYVETYAMLRRAMPDLNLFEAMTRFPPVSDPKDLDAYFTRASTYSHRGEIFYADALASELTRICAPDGAAGVVCRAAP